MRQYFTRHVHPTFTPKSLNLADAGPDRFVCSLFWVLSQAVHEDTVRLSMGTVIQQGPRIAERQFL